MTLFTDRQTRRGTIRGIPVSFHSDQNITFEELQYDCDKEKKRFLKFVFLI